MSGGFALMYCLTPRLEAVEKTKHELITETEQLKNLTASESETAVTEQSALQEALSDARSAATTKCPFPLL